MSSVDQVRLGPPGQELWDALRGRPAIPLPVLSLAGNKQLLKGVGLLVGGAVIDNALGAGAFSLIDGEGVNDPIIAELAWVAASCGILTVPEPGVIFRNGLFFSRNAGTLTGSIWIKL